MVEIDFHNIFPKVGRKKYILISCTNNLALLSFSIFVVVRSLGQKQLTTGCFPGQPRPAVMGLPETAPAAALG